jgi:hypothetical protein
MNALPSARPITLAIGLLLNVALLLSEAHAQGSPCGADLPCPVYIQHANVEPPQPAAPSWIFSRGTYTHDPYTGARVAQYAPIAPVEPLDDPRAITSRYRRSRTNLRGADGSTDTYYEVQQWGNGRGGLDAEWERFHDAWKESYLSGSYYNQSPYAYGPQYGGPGYGGPAYGGGYGGPIYGGGYGPPGYGYPGYGGPGYSFPPGYGGGPGYGGAPGHGGPPHGSPHGGGGGHPGHAD